MDYSGLILNLGAFIIRLFSRKKESLDDIIADSRILCTVTGLIGMIVIPLGLMWLKNLFGD